VSVTVNDLIAHLDDAIPFSWAEPWDRVGLLVGGSSEPVGRVLVTLDVTRAALRRAVDAGATVLLTHHPAFLQPLERLTWSGHGPDPALEALRAGVALIACHTNLDRAPEGAEALPAILGLEVLAPLERSQQDVSTIVVYAPSEAAESLLTAMEGAGAGRVGQYGGCAFVARGQGRFTPRAEARPKSGEPGQRAAVDECRIEMVCSLQREASVIEAVRVAHPYEEPVVLSSRSGLSRGAARMGRLCRPCTPVDVRGLAGLIGERLGVHCTVWGDPGRAVNMVAVAPGSGRSLVDDALNGGADTFVTGELRYHEALDAVEAGLAVIEAGHDATEWPLTGALARIARRMTGLAEDAVVLDESDHSWWTT
jgi:dinuclear metal center YbgI/SA1388 family protein